MRHVNKEDRDAWILGTLLIIAIVCVLAACSSPRPTVPALLADNAPTVEAEELFASSPTSKLLAAVLPTEPVRGWARPIHGATACAATHGVNPMVEVPNAEPRAGVQLVVRWTTRACVNPPPPAEATWLFVRLNSLRDPVQLDVFGHGPCQLLVLPQFQMVPSENPNAMLSQSGGTVTLRWTPDVSQVGSRWFAQLLVFAPGESPSGFLLSPGLDLLIGSPQ